jgi:beta-glucanase (GH16 family)
MPSIKRAVASPLDVIRPRNLFTAAKATPLAMLAISSFTEARNLPSLFRPVELTIDNHCMHPVNVQRPGQAAFELFPGELHVEPEVSLLSSDFNATHPDGAELEKKFSLPKAGGITATLCADSPWKLIFSDEFNGKDGSGIDEKKWKYKTGGGGWGNKELQHYTNRTENVRQENGALVLTAKKDESAGELKCWNGPCEATSGALTTEGKFDFSHGRVEARVQAPKGRGLWPAVWMLGADIGKKGWPACGEIDVMENLGHEPNKIYATLHGPGYSGASGLQKPHLGKDYSDGFHDFAVEWDPKEIRFFVDGEHYATQSPESLPPGGKWEFEKDFFLLLNLAVGGNWPGSPDEETKFPAEMKVDHVRVYQRAEEPAKAS